MSVVRAPAQKTAYINIRGGLGNQLFQIAFGYALTKRWPGTRLKLYIGSFHASQGSHPSKYIPTLYSRLAETICEGGPASLNKASNRHTEKSWAYYNMNNDVHKLFDAVDDVFFDGYWQSERHFANLKAELVDLFGLTHPYTRIPAHVFTENPLLHTDLSRSCLVGVRRGDYLKHPHIHNPCGMTYYNKAMSYFPADTRFFVISDDLDWCKLHFTGPNVVFLDIKDDLDTLHVGTLFPNYIISNSSFYWWISYFSIYPHPKIIAPDKWIAEPGYESIYRSDMVIVERPVEV